MYRTRLLFTILVFWGANCGICVFCQIKSAHFSRGEFLDGNSCASGDVILDITVSRKVQCMTYCSIQPTCHGVFIDQVTSRCVTCSARVFMQTASTGLIFYKREESPQVSTYLVVTDFLSWYSAKTHCENLGGHLLILSSSEENDIIVQYISTLEYIDSFFVGAKGTGGKAETFHWVDGTAVSNGFTNWESAQPFPTVTEEKYILIFRTMNHRWNDGDPGTTSSICEFE